MGKIGLGRAFLSTHIGETLRDKIDARAGGLSVTRSKYGSLILEWWAAQGCPPVNELDRLVQVSKQGMPAPVSAAQKKPPVKKP